jgi:CRP-like cAMP-binding protein
LNRDARGSGFASRRILYRQGEQIDRLYFSDSGVVSLVSVMSDGRRAEIGVVGTEGVVGVHAVHGLATMPCEALVQAAGEARVLSVQNLLNGTDFSLRLSSLMCQYSHALLLRNRAQKAGRHTKSSFETTTRASAPARALVIAKVPTVNEVTTWVSGRIKPWQGIRQPAVKRRIGFDTLVERVQRVVNGHAQGRRRSPKGRGGPWPTTW